MKRGRGKGKSEVKQVRLLTACCGVMAIDWIYGFTCCGHCGRWMPYMRLEVVQDTATPPSREMMAAAE